MNPSDPPRKDEKAANTPFPFPTAEHHEPPPSTEAEVVTETPTEEAIDHGIEESFPASDPVSVSVTKTLPASGAKPGRKREEGDADA